MESRILSLLQLCDSNFPTGAFSHSYGLESYIQEDKVHNSETFLEWLQVYVNELLIYSDGLACHLVFQLLKKNNIDEIWKLDRMLTMQNLPRETREGTMRIGERMLNLVQTLYEASILKQYQDRIKSKHSFGHPAIVFSMVAYHLGVSGSNTILYYLYSVVTSLVQNAVRAIPIGQTDGQKIIFSTKDLLVEAAAKIENLNEDDFGIVSPGLELSQMVHERVNIRIFMS